MADEIKEIKEEVPTEEAPKKKRGRKPKAVKEAVAPDVQEAVTETVNESPVDKTEKEADNEVKEVPVEEAPKKKRTRRTRQADILDEYRDARALLKGARQTMKILNSMVERIEYNENMKDAGTAITAVVQYNGFRILIPAQEIGLELPKEMIYQEKELAYKKYINPMIGANIDFVILRVDEKTNLAIGSRRIAMAIKKKQIYQNRNRAGKKTTAEWAMENKMPVEAHVMSVAGSTVKIEVFGVECRVFAREADWIYTSNLSSIFCPGDTIKCIIKEIIVNPDDKNDIKISASIKEAYPNKQKTNASTFKDGSISIGEITGVNTKGYYVLLGDRKTGISGFCSTIHGTEIPQVGDKVSCQIINVNPDEGYAFVKIIRIVQKKSHNHF